MTKKSRFHDRTRLEVIRTRLECLGQDVKCLGLVGFQVGRATVGNMSWGGSVKYHTCLIYIYNIAPDP